MNELKTFLDRLSPLSIVSWEKFSNLFTAKTLKKGQYYIRENQIAKEIGFLNSGILRAFYRSDNGTEYNKHFFLPHCFIGGYASLISKKTNAINQQALTDCELLVANYADIQKLYPSCPDIERISRLLAEQFFIQKEQREIEIVLMDAEKRYKIFQKDFPSLEQFIPQYHIASYLGITPTQLSRIRRKIAQK
ncbi:putative transcriptional regulator, Crp/Fnr family [Chryseobacterium sp. StRB126]|uniref:Crp/Fnr family transcriptional regulator n=1 Tax=Chryseobacterium sp. StRB126 TaxID=878220 RepID=UPI0004E99EA5|nr:Crp/Fnr family transcriptional regulator [Chryseobacterium sp. StRB126]BAP30954.1 putative transcriptional regulator, Crp/Fnr family [Chryseobacterium sp. StRB126]